MSLLAIFVWQTFNSSSFFLRWFTRWQQEICVFRWDSGQLEASGPKAQRDRLTSLCVVSSGPPRTSHAKCSAIVSNSLKLKEPQCLSVISFVEPQHVAHITTNGWLTVEASTFIYGPFNYRHRLNGGHSGSEMWLVQAGCVWRRERCCPVPLSHLGSEFTRSRQQQLTASTFRGRRKSVWFEAVCGSPSCGSEGAHSSQCQCASLEWDLRAGCCCCCLVIGEFRTLPRQPNSKRTAVPKLSHIVKYGDWNLHWAAPNLIFHLMLFAYDMFKY